MKLILDLLFQLLNNWVPVDQMELNRIKNQATAWMQGINPDDGSLKAKAMKVCEIWWVQLIVLCVYIPVQKSIHVLMTKIQRGEPLDEDKRD